MPQSNAITATEALRLLQEGNKRFVQGLRSVDSMIRSRDLAELAEHGQRPFTIVLACSDSRVPTEILFDRGPGDIFVCRVAGNVATPAIMGSIEFAAEQFGSALCVVMGHTKCGAIKATLNTPVLPPELSPNLAMVVQEIEPAAKRGRMIGPITDATIDETARLNVHHTIATIREKSPLLAGLLNSGKLSIVGAVCDIRTGAVSFEI